MTTSHPAPPPRARSRGIRGPRSLHPFVRWVVGGVVAMVVAGALIAAAILGRNTQASVYALLGAGVIGVGVGLLLFVESWIWSQRFWRDGSSGRSMATALVGGLAIMMAAVALAASAILLLTFGLG